MKERARFLAPMLQRIVDSLRDLAPIVIVIAFFQIVVLQQPFPNLGNVVIGLVCVVVGLALFIEGLESGLFPIGEVLARGLAAKGSLTTLLTLCLLPRIRHHGRRAGIDCHCRRSGRGCRGGRRDSR